MIYLDHSATTPLLPDVAEAMAGARDAANAGSIHRGGQRGRALLEDARATVAEALGTPPRTVVFTSGGTEANNSALKGIAFRSWRENARWPALLAPETEHHAVLHVLEYLAALGAPVQILPVDRNGRIDIDLLRQTLSTLPHDPPPIVAVMHANNETGTLQPIGEIASVVHETGGLLHCDAVQSFGKIPVMMGDLGADTLSTSAHKLHGPRGIGALVVRDGVGLDPLLHGGAQERRRRAGTEPVELAVGFAEAVRLAMNGMAEREQYLRSLLDHLRNAVSQIAGAEIVTPESDTLPTVLNVTFADAAQLDGEGLIAAMDLEGVAVSNGSACTSGSQQPSHVLLAMGRTPEQSRAAVRFSLGRTNTHEEIDAAVAALKRVLERMRE